MTWLKLIDPAAHWLLVHDQILAGFCHGSEHFLPPRRRLFVTVLSKHHHPDFAIDVFVRLVHVLPDCGQPAEARSCLELMSLLIQPEDAQAAPNFNDQAFEQLTKSGEEDL